MVLSLKINMHNFIYKMEYLTFVSDPGVTFGLFKMQLALAQLSYVTSCWEFFRLFLNAFFIIICLSLRLYLCYLNHSQLPRAAFNN